MSKSIYPPLPPSAEFYSVMKKPVPVSVRFAETAGTLKTLEGDVHYEKGAALLTGQHQDQWPVERAVFNATYIAINETQFGETGTYQKRPIKVIATPLSQATSVTVGYANSPLRGEIGDWLVQYGTDDYGIVSADIFEATYDILNKKTN